LLFTRNIVVELFPVCRIESFQHLVMALLDFAQENVHVILELE